MNPLVILILVARGGASEPATQGAVRATRELLGPDVQVEVREFDELPSDERALSVAGALRAAVTVELLWDPESRRQARIRFHFKPRAQWHDRIIGFERDDDPAERGRTIGYALASMLPPSSPGTSQPGAGVVRKEAETRASSSGAELSARSRPAGSIDVTGASAVGLGGPAAGWGGTASGRWFFARRLAVRVGGSARAGQVAEAQASSLLVHASLGVAWIPLSATKTSPFELGGRIGVLALHEQLTHFSSDDPEPVPLARWLPGADAALEATWFFSSGAGAVASAGAEFAFGTTDVNVHWERVATIPPIRLVMQAGVRAMF